MTTNVLTDRVMRTVFFGAGSRHRRVCWHVVVDNPASLGNSRRTSSGKQNVRIQEQFADFACLNGAL